MGLAPVGGRPSAVGKGAGMPRARLPYSAEFRVQLVERVRAGRELGNLAREFEKAAQFIRARVAKAEDKAG